MDTLNKCYDNNMSLNVSKCHTMRVYFGKTPITPLDVKLANQTLEQIDCVKILGVTVQSNLKWNRECTCYDLSPLPNFPYKILSLFTHGLLDPPV